MRPAYKVGDKFTLTNDACENYGSQYIGRVFTVSHVATSIEEHRGFDEGAGSALYDAHELNFSVYEWEMEAAQ